MGKQAGSARPKEVRAGAGGQVWAGSPSLMERRGPLSFHRRRRQSLGRSRRKLLAPTPAAWWFLTPCLRFSWLLELMQQGFHGLPRPR